MPKQTNKQSTRLRGKRSNNVRPKKAQRALPDTSKRKEVPKRVHASNGEYNAICSSPVCYIRNDV